MSKLIDFYLGEGMDVVGRMLSDVWQFTDDSLEGAHDYIQWLFPTVKPSNYNPEAPLLTPEDIVLFQANPKLRENLLISFEKILSFFGLRLAEEHGHPVVRKGVNYLKREHVLFKGFNHNHLRVTRILDCLNSVGLRDYSRALFEFLLKNKALFSANCFKYWENAMRDNGIEEGRLARDKATGERLRELEGRLALTPKEEDEKQRLHYQYYIENEDIRRYWKTRAINPSL